MNAINMNFTPTIVRREFRVAFSKRAQPVWFRVIKWAMLIALTAMFWHEPVFWWSLLAASLSGFVLHLFYRWKTLAWTRPWGGWNDIAAGHDKLQS